MLRYTHSTLSISFIVAYDRVQLLWSISDSSLVTEPLYALRFSGGKSFEMPWGNENRKMTN